MDDEIYPSFVVTGRLMDLTEKMKRDLNLEDYFPQALAAYNWFGKYYAIPMEGAAVIIHYNKDLLKEAGLPYPTNSLYGKPDYTWETYLEACKKLTKDTDGDGKIDQYGTSIRQWWPDWQAWMWAAGGAFYNKEMTECTLDSPESIKGFQFMCDLILKYKVTPSPAVQREEATAALPGGLNLFRNGKLGFFIYGPWALKQLVKQEDLDFDFCLMPEGPAGSWCRNTWGSIAINADAKDPELAWDIVKTACQPEFQRIIAEGFDLPPRRSVAYSEYFAFNPNTSFHEYVFITALENYSRLTQITLRYPEASQIIAAQMEKILLGDIKPTEALKEIAPKLEKLLAPEDKGRWNFYYEKILKIQ